MKPEDYEARIHETLDQLDQEIMRLETELREFPKGKLLTSCSHGTTQYYWNKSQTTYHGEYISKTEQDLVVALSKKRYYEEALEIDYKNRMQLKKMLAHVGGIQPKSATIQKLPEGIQTQIGLDFSLDKPYLDHWLSTHKTDEEFRPEGRTLQTDAGHMVRSKSEQLIANLLDNWNIPYVYEQALQLKGRTIHPDFTILDVATHQDIILEHFGKLDDPEYLEGALWKINAYTTGGYKLFERFFYSMESQQNPFQLQTVADLLAWRLGTA